MKQAPYFSKSKFKFLLILSFAVLFASASSSVSAATTIGANISTDGNLSIAGNSTLGTIISGLWNGTVIGPIFGGTGLTSYTLGDIIYASATNILSKLAIGTDGQVLTVAGGVPTWATPTSSSVTSVFGRTGDVVATTNDYTWAQIDKTTSSLADITTRNISDTTGTLTVSRGGTNGTATPTAGAVAYGTGTAYAFTSAGTAGQVLTSAGAGTPTWATASSGILTTFCIGSFNNPGETTLFMPGFGGTSTSCASSTEASGMPVGAATWRNLRVNCGTAFSTADRGKFTVRKNNSTDTTLTCTVGNTSTTCNDTTNSFTTNAGDVLTISVFQGAGGETGANCNVSFDRF
jgi:hypothetical protein